MTRTTAPFALLALLFAGASPRVSAQDQVPLVIRGASIIPRPEAEPLQADVLIEGGRIVGVGAGLAAPEGARVLDLRGHLLLPAFVDAANDGLLSAGSVAAGPAEYARDLLDAGDPRGRLALLRAGVGAVYADAPPRGNAVAGGTGCIVLTDPEPMLPTMLDERAGATFRVTGRAQNETNVLVRRAAVRAIETALDGAERYRKTWEEFEAAKKKYEEDLAAWEKAQKEGGKTGEPPKEEERREAPRTRPARPQLPEGFRTWPPDKQREWMREAMQRREGAAAGAGGGADAKPGARPKPPATPRTSPADETLVRVLKREVPLRVEAHWREDIEAVVDMARKRRIRLVIFGASEYRRVSSAHREFQAALVLGAPVSLVADVFDQVSARPGSAAALAEAGASLAFKTGGEAGLRFDSLPELARLHGSEGLPAAACLAALTTGGAAAIGMEDSLGRIEAGYRAVLQARKGGGFDFSAPVTHMIFGTQVIEVGGFR